MSHGNAALTPRQRLRVARLIINDGWTVAAAADYFRISWPTAAKWARRYVELGPEGWPIGPLGRTRIRTGPRSCW